METPAGGMPTACVVQFISFSACVILTFLLKLPCVCVFFEILFNIGICLVCIFPVIDQVFVYKKGKNGFFVSLFGAFAFLN